MPSRAVVLGLILWPAVVFWSAASWPSRVVREAEAPDASKRVVAMVVAPFLGLGLLVALGGLWVVPATSAIGALAGRAPHEPTGTGWVLVYVIAFLVTPGWAWLLERLVDDLRRDRPPGHLGLPEGGLALMLCVLGALEVLAWFTVG